jgi:hypothetical protein
MPSKGGDLRPVQRGKIIGQLIDESLEFYGIQLRESMGDKLLLQEAGIRG